MREMDDARLLAGFEQCDLGEQPFGHREHVRTAWLMLRREPLLPAMRRYADAIRRFAIAKGAPDKYHETITIAFLLLIHERMEGGAVSSLEFLEANRDLLDMVNGPIAQLYGQDLLADAEARRRFMLPAA